VGRSGATCIACGVACTAVAVQAVVDATWSDNSGSVGSVGMAWRGEADTPSQGGVGVEGGGTEVVVGVLGGMVAFRVVDGGVAETDSGERISLFSSSWSRSSSTSFRHHLVFLASGGWISGEEGVGGAGGSVESAVGRGSAAATGGDGSTGSSHTAVAARLHLWRWHRRRLLAGVSVTAGAGMLHKTVKTWHPAAWLMFTLAFRPLATQRWYSAEKSAAVITAGAIRGRLVSPRVPLLLPHSPTCEPREVEGRGEVSLS
jgi:hypothetical protein